MENYLLGALMLMVGLGVKTISTQLGRLMEQNNDHLAIQKELLEELKKIKQSAKSL